MKASKFEKLEKNQCLVLNTIRGGYIYGKTITTATTSVVSRYDKDSSSDQDVEVSGLRP